ncbi:MAG: class I SAM-dependent methyltransferase [Burkholderiaceae bacterium]
MKNLAATNYFSNPRPELVERIRQGPNRVLEVGCAEGVMGGCLKQSGMARQVIGIEINPDAAKLARTRIDEVHCGDIEQMSLDSGEFRARSFDYVICGDVIEHLRCPEVVVKRLLTLLKPDGYFIVSVPNVRHWSVVSSLLFAGEWRYEPFGIMDETHMRFFTRKSILRLLREANTELVEVKPSYWTKVDRLGPFATLGLGREFFCRQWVAVVRPRDTAIRPIA